MSKRHEIIDGADAWTSPRGLVYTEVLGWVDLGHARGDDVRTLMWKLNQGEASGADRYDVSYNQSMVSPFGLFRIGKFMTWRIRRGRSFAERQQIVLAMMMTMARKFEGFQGAFPSNLITDSGFSGEDLCSDLLGFYRAMQCINPFPMLRPVSKAEALKRWDYYGEIGVWKNETFRPLLFPDPERFPHTRPYLGHLPGFMQTIWPYNDWQSGNVAVASPNGTFIQGGKRKDLIV
ncbi:hypothetical protein Z042_14225 [Chania multitudinisentens RB-25]|uniref:Uncharacterized protein n=1 Tax=Chania multitudinisentens RB-25 TaxID=1441930 RepID=W0LA03_9GAMM|nr:hypothetical protein [Chania multitudinisentens]AHG20648.1 hypothetical protein Z042_14225 [Chania multitudinisentens RB-25]